MTRTELVKKMAEKSGLTQKDADKCLAAFMESVTEALQADDKVALVGFGTFETRIRAARQGRNLHTGETIEIAESRYASWKPSKVIKESLNN